MKTTLRCANCKTKASAKVFEGVMICEDCSKMVDVIIDRRRKELAVLETLYRDKLRVTLLEGKLSPKVIHDECSNDSNQTPGGVSR